jgi:hypothetical protein
MTILFFSVSFSSETTVSDKSNIMSEKHTIENKECNDVEEASTPFEQISKIDLDRLGLSRLLGSLAIRSFTNGVDRLSHDLSESPSAGLSGC